MIQRQRSGHLAADLRRDPPAAPVGERRGERERAGERVAQPGGAAPERAPPSSASPPKVSDAAGERADA